MYKFGHLDNGQNQEVSQCSRDVFPGHNMNNSSCSLSTPPSDNVAKSSTTSVLRRWRRPDSHDNTNKNVPSKDNVNSSSATEKQMNYPAEASGNTGNEFSMYVPQLSPLVPQSTARPYDNSKYLVQFTENGVYNRNSSIVPSKDKNTLIHNSFYHQDGTNQELHYRNNYPVQNTPPLAHSSSQKCVLPNENNVYPTQKINRDYINPHSDYSTYSHQKMSSLESKEEPNYCLPKTGYVQDSRISPQNMYLQNTVDRRVSPHNPKSPVCRNQNQQNFASTAQNINYLSQKSVIDARYVQNYNYYKPSAVNSDQKHLRDYRNIVAQKKSSPPFPILEQRLNQTDSNNYPDYAAQNYYPAKYGPVVYSRTSPTSKMVNNYPKIPPQEVIIPSYQFPNKFYPQNQMPKEYEQNLYLSQMNQMHARLNQPKNTDVPRDLSYVDPNQRISQKSRMFCTESNPVEHMQYSAKSTVPQKSPKMYNTPSVSSDYLNLSRSCGSVVKPTEYQRKVGDYSPVIQSLKSAEMELSRDYYQPPNDQQNYAYSPPLIGQARNYPPYPVAYPRQPKINEIPPRNISPRRTFQENMPVVVLSPHHIGLSKPSPSPLYPPEYPNHQHYPGYYSRDPVYPETAKPGIPQYPIDPGKYPNVNRNIQQQRYHYGYPETQAYPESYPVNMYRQHYPAEHLQQNRNFEMDYRGAEASNYGYDPTRSEDSYCKKDSDVGKSLKEFLESWEDDEEIVANLPDLVLCNNIPAEKQKLVFAGSSEETSETSKSSCDEETPKSIPGEQSLYVLDSQHIPTEIVSQYLAVYEQVDRLPDNIKGFYENPNKNGNQAPDPAVPDKEITLKTPPEPTISESVSPHDLTVDKNREEKEEQVLNLSTNRNKENNEFLVEEYSNCSEENSVKQEENKIIEEQSNLDNNSVEALKENCSTIKEKPEEIEENSPENIVEEHIEENEVNSPENCVLVVKLNEEIGEKTPTKTEETINEIPLATSVIVPNKFFDIKNTVSEKLLHFPGNPNIISAVSTCSPKTENNPKTTIKTCEETISNCSENIEEKSSKLEENITDLEPIQADKVCTDVIDFDTTDLIPHESEHSTQKLPKNQIKNNREELEPISFENLINSPENIEMKDDESDSEQNSDNFDKNLPQDASLCNKNELTDSSTPKSTDISLLEGKTEISSLENEIEKENNVNPIPTLEKNTEQCNSSIQLSTVAEKTKDEEIPENISTMHVINHENIKLENEVEAKIEAEPSRIINKSAVEEDVTESAEEVVNSEEKSEDLLELSSIPSVSSYILKEESLEIESSPVEYLDNEDFEEKVESLTEKLEENVEPSSDDFQNELAIENNGDTIESTKENIEETDSFIPEESSNTVRNPADVTVSIEKNLHDSSAPITEVFEETVVQATEDFEEKISPAIEDTGETIATVKEDNEDAIVPTIEDTKVIIAPAIEDTVDTIAPKTEDGENTVAPITEDSEDTVILAIEDNEDIVATFMEDSKDIVSEKEDNQNLVGSTTKAGEDSTVQATENIEEIISPVSKDIEDTCVKATENTKATSALAKQNSFVLVTEDLKNTDTPKEEIRHDPIVPTTKESEETMVDELNFEETISVDEIQETFGSCEETVITTEEIEEVEYTEDLDKTCALSSEKIEETPVDLEENIDNTTTDNTDIIINQEVEESLPLETEIENSSISKEIIKSQKIFESTVDKLIITNVESIEDDSCESSFKEDTLERTFETDKELSLEINKEEVIDNTEDVKIENLTNSEEDEEDEYSHLIKIETLEDTPQKSSNPSKKSNIRSECIGNNSKTPNNFDFSYLESCPDNICDKSESKSENSETENNNNNLKSILDSSESDSDIPKVNTEDNENKIDLNTTNNKKEVSLEYQTKDSNKNEDISKVITEDNSDILNTPEKAINKEENESISSKSEKENVPVLINIEKENDLVLDESIDEENVLKSEKENGGISIGSDQDKIKIKEKSVLNEFEMKFNEKSSMSYAAEKKPDEKEIQLVNKSKQKIISESNPIHNSAKNDSNEEEKPNVPEPIIEQIVSETEEIITELVITETLTSESMDSVFEVSTESIKPTEISESNESENNTEIIEEATEIVENLEPESLIFSENSDCVVYYDGSEEYLIFQPDTETSELITNEFESQESEFVATETPDVALEKEEIVAAQESEFVVTETPDIALEKEEIVAAPEKEDFITEQPTAEEIIICQDGIENWVQNEEIIVSNQEEEMQKESKIIKDKRDKKEKKILSPEKKKLLIEKRKRKLEKLKKQKLLTTERFLIEERMNSLPEIKPKNSVDEKELFMNPENPITFSTEINTKRRMSADEFSSPKIDFKAPKRRYSTMETGRIMKKPIINLDEISKSITEVLENFNRQEAIQYQHLAKAKQEIKEKKRKDIGEEKRKDIKEEIFEEKKEEQLGLEKKQLTEYKKEVDVTNLKKKELVKLDNNNSTSKLVPNLVKQLINPKLVIPKINFDIVVNSALEIEKKQSPEKSSIQKRRLSLKTSEIKENFPVVVDTSRLTKPIFPNSISEPKSIPKRPNVDPRIERPNGELEKETKPSLIDNKLSNTFSLTEYTKNYIKMKTGQVVEPKIIDPNLAKTEENKINLKRKQSSKENCVSSEKKIKINLQDYRKRKLSQSDPNISDNSTPNEEVTKEENEDKNLKHSREISTNKVENQNKPKKSSEEVTKGTLLNPVVPKVTTNSEESKETNSTNKLDCKNLEPIDNVNSELKNSSKQRPKKRKKRFRNLYSADEEEDVPTKQQKNSMDTVGKIEEKSNSPILDGTKKDLLCCLEVNPNGTVKNDSYKCQIKLNSQVVDYEINKNSNDDSSRLKLTFKPVKKKPAFSEVLSNLDSLVESEILSKRHKKKLGKSGVSGKVGKNGDGTLWTINNKVPKVIIRKSGSGYCAVFRDVSSNPIWQPKIRLKRQKYIESLVLTDNLEC